MPEVKTLPARQRIVVPFDGHVIGQGFNSDTAERVDSKRQVLCWRKRRALGSLQWLSDATPADPKAAREVAPLGVVLADAEFDSEQRATAMCTNGSER